MPHSSEKKKHIREVRRESGLCTNCGLVPPSPGRVKCEDCLRKHATRHLERRLQVYDVLGRKCEQCGGTDVGTFQIDHRNGDGSSHRAEIVGNKERSGSIAAGYVIEQDILDSPDVALQRYQLLCANCHAKKHSSFRFIKEDVWLLLA